MNTSDGKQRAKAMCRSIRLAWSSLRSHLQYAVVPNPAPDSDEDELHHAKAICEYAEQILICAKELKHINSGRVKQ